jgi:hypothetical protein
VNNFIAQQIYSPGGLQPTGEAGNRLFAVVFYCDFNISDKTTLKNHGLGKVHVPKVYKKVNPAQFIYQ